jgi:hypothetical protein
MSDTLDAPDGIRLGAFRGPADEGDDRQRWQIETDGTVTLTREGVYWLMAALTASLYERPLV